MKKNMLIILLMIIVSINCTGCSRSAEAEAIFSFSANYVQLINTFSINSESAVTTSKGLKNSIFIEYKNGDSLYIFLDENRGNLSVDIEYVSNNILSTEQICDMLFYINNTEVNPNTKEKIEEFLVNKNKVEVEHNDRTYLLRYEDDTFILSRK